MVKSKSLKPTAPKPATPKPSGGRTGRPLDPTSGSGLARQHQELKNRKLALEIAAYEGRLIPRTEVAKGFSALVSRFRGALDSVVLHAADEAQRGRLLAWARDTCADLSRGIATLSAPKTRRGRPRKTIQAASR